MHYICNPGTGHDMGHMLRLLNLRIETDEERIPLLISEVIVKETHSIIVFCPLAKTLKKR